MCLVKRAYQRAISTTLSTRCRLYRTVEHEDLCIMYWRHQIVTVLKMSSSNKILDCDQCEFTCTQLLILQQHRGKVHHTYRYPCEICEYSCHSKADMRQHRLKDHDIAAFSCDICEYRCSEMSNLRKHSKIHEERVVKEKLKCDKCEAEYLSTKGLRRHKQRIHGAPNCSRTPRRPEPITCDQCGKIYKTRHGWRAHYKIIHLGVESTSLPRYLQRIYQCTECEFRAASNYLLRNHMRSHTKEKPYKCEYCSKGLSTQAALSRHHRTHTGEKPIKCKECPEMFANHAVLSVHMSTHHYPKWYYCGHCNGCFTMKRNMRSHHRKRHPELPLKYTETERSEGDDSSTEWAMCYFIRLYYTYNKIDTGTGLYKVLVWLLHSLLWILIFDYIQPSSFM